MATRAELEQALIAADKAGNVEDARALADALANFKETPNVDKTQSDFDALPWYQKALTAADDGVRLLANGLTLGWADNLAGAMGGEGTDAEKLRSDEARIRAGSAATPLELLGMVAPAGAASKLVGAGTGLVGNTIATTAAREGLAGAGTGIFSALSDTGDPMELLTSAGLGLGMGAAGGAVGAAAGKGINAIGQKLGLKGGALVDDVVPGKSLDEMRAAKDAAYAVPELDSVTYDPAGFAAMKNNMAAQLNNARVNPRLHPNASAMMDDISGMANTGSGRITPRDMDELRQVINRDVTGTPGEDYMANIMRRNVDEFIGAGPTIAGNADDAGKALATARDLNRRTRLTEDVERALFRGENAASDRGDINALRTMLNNPNKTRGMSAAEKAAMQKVVRGDTIENVLRKIGRAPVTPIGAGILAGGATANPLIGLAAGIGTAGVEPLLEGAARKYTDANVKALRDVITGGSTTPAAARGILSAGGQAAGVQFGETERKKVRRRKKRRD